MNRTELRQRAETFAEFLHEQQANYPRPYEDLLFGITSMLRSI